MPDEFDILEGTTENAWPILGTRWLVKNSGEKVLQQAYITNTGKYFWEDIPVVQEKDEGD